MNVGTDPGALSDPGALCWRTAIGATSLPARRRLNAALTPPPALEISWCTNVGTNRMPQIRTSSTR